MPQKMKLPSLMAILFNGAAILIAGASISIVVRSALFHDDATPCSERYPTATRFALDHEGAPLTPADLQSRLGNTDWNIAQGARVVKLRTGPAKYALELDLASVPAAVPKPAGDQKVGLGFSWTPQGMGRAKAACLAYGVFLPEGFHFGRGGRLPGIAGTSGISSDSPEPVFSTRYTWGAKGELDFHTHLPDWPEGRSLGNERSGMQLEPGRWMAFEQEVVLNQIGKSDGLLRIWHDGRLVFQKTGLAFRSKPSVQISGVLAEAAAGEQPPRGKPGPQKIWITPLELRWL